jgi:hypothetical protein
MTAHRSIYNENGIGMDQLAAAVPSVFSPTAFSGMSARYGFVPTANIVEDLRSNGFQCVQAGQTLTRVEGKRDFTRHVLRFRPSYSPTVGGSLPEVVLMNSHDGSSGFKLWAGLFRMVCANGLIVCTNTMAGVSIPHRSNAVEAVRAQSFDFLSRIDHLADTVQAYQARMLSDEEAYHLAEVGAQIRWGAERPSGLNSRELLLTRRYEDARQNLWNVLNTIQENLTRGGISLARPNRRSSTRGMRSVADDTRMNVKLWAAADEFLSGNIVDVEAVEVA